MPITVHSAGVGWGEGGVGRRREAVKEKGGREGKGGEREKDKK